MLPAQVMKTSTTLGGQDMRSFVHVPTPGDHYSPATGSAVMTIVYHMARQHAARGGKTRVMVSRGTMHDYDAGEAVEVLPTFLPAKWQKGIDASVGRLGLDRPFGTKAYLPASEAIERNFNGSIFIHNNPVAIRAFKASHPDAQVCLWAHNRLFDTYSRREIIRIEESADRLICVSEYIAKELLGRLGRDSKKVRVVHNGVDVDLFHPLPVPQDDGAPTILFVGRVQPVKGPDLLLKAALSLAARGYAFRIKIVGSSGFSATDPLTPFEQELRRLAAPLGDRVKFLPFMDRTRIATEYRKASIFCVPARWEEPFGMTTLEGMASGLPTVVSLRGGIREAAGDAALYFTPPDTDLLAEHLAVLLNDTTVRQEWSCKSRRRAEEFSWARQYEVLLAATAQTNTVTAA